MPKNHLFSLLFNYKLVYWIILHCTFFSILLEYMCIIQHSGSVWVVSKCALSVTFGFGVCFMFMFHVFYSLVPFSCHVFPWLLMCSCHVHTMIMSCSDWLFWSCFLFFFFSLIHCLIAHRCFLLVNSLLVYTALIFPLSFV